MECVLFEVVSRDARPHPEERACRKGPQTGTRVRASRRMRTAPISGLPEIGRVECPSRLQPTWAPSCFETHRGALGLWKHLRSHPAAMLLSMRARGAAHFGQTKPSGEYACLVRA